MQTNGSERARDGVRVYWDGREDDFFRLVATCQCVRSKTCRKVSFAVLDLSCGEEKGNGRKRSLSNQLGGYEMSAQCVNIKGLTLLELLVVISVIGLLAALLLPAINAAKTKAIGVSCLGNLKQLQSCWQMYADDNNGFLPPNRSQRGDDGWRSTPDSWIGNSSAPLDANFVNIQQGLLFKYDLNKSVALYHCPADKSRVMNCNMLRTRSYSMSGCLGGRTNEVQKSVDRLNAIPAPLKLFVFIDENEDSIDDGHFLTWPDPDNRWVNMPAGRHGQCGVLSFADGHAERWKWLWAKNFKNRPTYWKATENEADLKDLRRLQNMILPLADFVPQP